nr:hypothetical transcript [Hymenolepis microstoma]
MPDILTMDRLCGGSNQTYQAPRTSENQGVVYTNYSTPSAPISERRRGHPEKDFVATTAIRVHPIAKISVRYPIKTDKESDKNSFENENQPPQACPTSEQILAVRLLILTSQRTDENNCVNSEFS